MYTNKLERGKLYEIKLTNGQRAIGRFIEEQVLDYPGMRKRTRFIFSNVRTGRDIRIKSRVKILGERTESHE